MYLENIVFSATVVISSKGRAAQAYGELLGQYEYHEDNDYYLQKSTEQSNGYFKIHILVADSAYKWWVTDASGIGWLLSSSSGKTLPTTSTSRWQFYCQDHKQLHDDLTLKVTSGPLPPLPRQFTVTNKPGCQPCAGARAPWQSYLGVFNRTERWWDGRPVYVNMRGMFLHHGPKDLGWVIGIKLGTFVLRGSRARHSPADEDKWGFFDGSDFKIAPVTVTGSDKIY